MKQDEIVNEIRRMCGQTIQMPSLGWHFKYNGQVYFYVVGKDERRKNTHNECYGYLLLHLLHPHCMCDASTNVLYGEKDSLLKFLNSNEGIENLIHGARTLDEKLKNWDDQ